MVCCLRLGMITSGRQSVLAMHGPRTFPFIEWSSGDILRTEVDWPIPRVKFMIWPWFHFHIMFSAIFEAYLKVSNRFYSAWDASIWHLSQSDVGWPRLLWGSLSWKVGDFGDGKHNMVPQETHAIENIAWFTLHWEIVDTLKQSIHHFVKTFC